MSLVRDLAGFLANTPWHPQWLMPGRIVPAALANATGTVLDIGAADRWLRPHLLQEAHYIALDYPSTALALYRTRPDVFADACRLPFASSSLDAIACFEVLEHVADPESALREIARTLKPGGVACVSMPFLYPVHDAPHDYQRWTEHGWRRSANAAGLPIEAITPMLHPIKTAAVLGCLALAGPLQGAGPISLLARLPLVIVLVPLINIIAWCLAIVWPSWPAMTTGNRLVLRKP